MKKHSILMTALVGVALAAPAAFAQEVDQDALRDAERAAAQASQAADAAETRAQQAEQDAWSADRQAQQAQQQAEAAQWEAQRAQPIEEEEEDPS
jgi:hypothetical protein